MAWKRIMPQKMHLSVKYYSETLLFFISRHWHCGKG